MSSSGCFHASKRYADSFATRHSIQQERRPHIALFILSLVAAILQVGFGVQIIVNPLDSGTSYFIAGALLLASLLMVILAVVSVVSWTCLAERMLRSSLTLEIFFEAYAFVIFVATLVLFYASGSTLASGSHIAALPLVPALAVVFSRKLCVMVFWSVLVLVVIVSSLARELAVPSLVVARLEMYIATPRFRTFYLYICVFSPYIFTISSLFVVLLGRDRDHKLMLETAKAISRLDFNNESLQKLRDKDEKACSETELVMKQTLRNMEAYARFLPDHLKAGIGRRDDHDDNVKDEEAGEEEEEKVAMTEPEPEPIDFGDYDDVFDPTPPGLSPCSLQSSPSSPCVRPMEIQILCSPSKGTTRTSRFLENTEALSVHLITQAGTVMVCHIQSMHNLLLQRFDTSLVFENFHAMTDALATLCKSYRGTFDGIHGDKFVLSWNTSRMCLPHAKNAVRCASDFVERLYTIQPHKEALLDVVVTIASGEILSGPVGTSVKRYVMLGWPWALACQMERHLIVPFPPRSQISKVGGSESSYVLVGENVREIIKFEYATRVASVINVGGRLTRVFLITKTLHSGHGDDDEWLYEIASHLNESNPNPGDETREKEWEIFWRGVTESAPIEELLDQVRKLVLISSCEPVDQESLVDAKGILGVLERQRRLVSRID